MDSLRYVGLDVHKESITVAVAEPGGEVHVLGTIPHEPEAVTRLVRRLQREGALRCCYEAGPCGYDLYRQLHALDVPCAVVAPTLIPVRPGDRVKTDRRDAAKLARLLRSGDLTPVWVPDAGTEALRDLVRARHAALADLVRAKHRAAKFLLRQGQRAPQGPHAWTKPWWAWVRSLALPLPGHQLVLGHYLTEVTHQQERVRALDQAITAAVATAPPALRTVVTGLQAVHSVGPLTAVTLVTEIGSFARFSSPRPLMAYCGLVPREHSSGGTVHRGPITKTGNARCRHVLIEAAWHFRRPGGRGGHHTRRLALVPEALRPTAARATQRLPLRYRHLVARGKTPTQAVTAVARELLGFVWAVATALEAPPA